jgi:hypothetical protein
MVGGYGLPTITSSLLRAVDVFVDRASWRAQPVAFRHRFPLPLGRQHGPFPIHLLAMLLRVGELTTPMLNIQSGVARLWPLLRYLHAIADMPGLRFRTKWAETDRHQKAIASDDLGVGLGMSVLYAAFNYTACVDGRAFLYRLGQLGLLASYGGMSPKVGTMKMADYAAVDARGRFHIIECKGTQQAYSTLGAAMTEGQSQKRSLACQSVAAERRLIGQRLVVGTALTLESSSRDTRVVVMDPAPLAEEPAVLRATISTEELREPALRLEVSRALGTAGSFRAAEAIGQIDLPEGHPVLIGPDQRDRVQAALSQDEAELERFGNYGESWRGEQVTVPLIAPLTVGDRTYRFARMSRGISDRLAGELREGGAATPLFQDLYPETSSLFGAGKVETGETYAALVRPGISLSTVELLGVRKA